ncbi:IS200/IS605 family transposase [Patescibacteria group bacterium]|nr:IS200/IS605 family transposase [Patescibacteria group bacterium]
MEAKKTAQTEYDLRYHFVWVPKRRRKILVGEISKKIEGMIKYACQLHEFEIYELHIAQDHVHLYLGAKPKYSPSEIMNIIKGGTARKIRDQFPRLEESVWRTSFWQDGYFVRSLGSINDSIVRRYIQRHRDHS